MRHPHYYRRHRARTLQTLGHALCIAWLVAAAMAFFWLLITDGDRQAMQDAPEISAE